MKKQIVSDTLDQVEVVYLDRSTTKWWNARRRESDTPTFCGYYWIKGDDEAGPFRSRSAALRDAYYRFVLREAVPVVAHSLRTSSGRKRRFNERSVGA